MLKNSEKTELQNVQLNSDLLKKLPKHLSYYHSFQVSLNQINNLLIPKNLNDR